MSSTSGICSRASDCSTTSPFSTSTIGTPSMNACRTRSDRHDPHVITEIQKQNVPAASTTPVSE